LKNFTGAVVNLQHMVTMRKFCNVFAINDRLREFWQEFQNFTQVKKYLLKSVNSVVVRTYWSGLCQHAQSRRILERVSKSYSIFKILVAIDKFCENWEIFTWLVSAHAIFGDFSKIP